jgi:cytochrome c553
MKHKTNFNGLPMRTFCALVGMLFMSAIHAEDMPAAASGAEAASAVAAVPAASEAAPASTPVAAPATPEVASAPGAIPPLEERLLLCGGCHNPDGNSIIPENPRLAGLDAKYIARQLADFKSGKRSNPTMSSIIPMVDESEFKSLGKFFSQQKRLTSESANAELVAKGKQIFEEGVLATAAPACMGCHGEDGSGSDTFPRLNGQNPAYVVNQLTNFKNGGRSNDAKGLMQAVAKRLSEQDMAAVAEYMSTLKEAE